MSQLISQLEVILRQMLDEHRVLLERVSAHEAALRSHDVTRIERAAWMQDESRQRITRLDNARRAIVAQIGRQHRQLREVTLVSIAEIFPDRKLILLQLREEIARLANEVREKVKLISRIAGGVLGHLNATARVIAEAANGPGTYRRNGQPAATTAGLLNTVG